MRTFLTALAVATFTWTASAAADDIDLSTWTCSKFLSANSADVGIILAWLDGYYKDEDDPPVIETHDFMENSKKLADYCRAHPDIGLITATDKLFQKE